MPVEAQVRRLDGELHQMRELEFPHLELFKSEKFLKSLVDELEGVEYALRNSKEMWTKVASLKVRRLEECLTGMSELQNSNVNTYEDACCALRDEEGGLIIKVVRLQSEVESARHREAVLVEGKVQLQVELVKALETVKTINRKMAELVEHNSVLHTINQVKML